MAGAGAKKRAEQNKQRLQTLKLVVLAASVFYAVVRLWLFRSTVTWWHWAGVLLTVAVHAVCYTFISHAGTPVYDQAGELVDGGADLDKGMVSYYHDILYVTALVQVVAAFTSWGWYLYLSVPAYAAYLLYTKIIQPYMSTKRSTAEDVMDEATRKRLERAEKRSERRRNKRF